MRNPSKSSAPESAAAVEGRRRSGGPTPCCTKSGVKRGPWTPEEDEVLASFVRREGEGRWRTLPKRAGLRRCGKSCRLRWMNYLRPSIKHGPIAPDEEDLILRLHRLLGNRWSLIAGRIPGRTDNEIKNYWNTHLSKKLISQGIDPRTHKPLANISSSTPDAIQQPLPSYVSPNPSTDFPNPGLNPHHDDGYADDGGWKESEFVTDGEMGSIDCYTDDIFSSFLDSLINEEVFQQHDHVLDKGDLDNVIECNNLSSPSSGGGGSNEPADASASPPVASFGVGTSRALADPRRLSNLRCLPTSPSDRLQAPLHPRSCKISRIVSEKIAAAMRVDTRKKCWNHGNGDGSAAAAMDQRERRQRRIAIGLARGKFWPLRCRICSWVPSSAKAAPWNSMTPSIAAPAP